MIRQPVSVGGSGGGADYESFRVDSGWVWAEYTDQSGQTKNPGYSKGYQRLDGIIACQKNSVYVKQFEPPEPSKYDVYLGISIEDGVLVFSVKQW